MKIGFTFPPSRGRRLTETEAGSREREAAVLLLQERLDELERDLDSVNWTRISFEANQEEFSREGLRKIAALSRLFFLKNPLIRRAVTLQAMYVWGQGVSIQARHPAVDAVVQAFLDDEANRAELTSHQARTLKEQDLQVEGNLFFVLFHHLSTGRTRVRTIPADEIDEIVTDPDDRKSPWYYLRRWTEPERGGVQTAYYPDWRYHPDAQPSTYKDKPVMWDTPVYHVKVGGLSDMRFGVPEVYSALDWARAYKEFLEDWATIVRAYSRFAFKVTTPGGRKGIAAAKSRLTTTLTSGSTETNPPPIAGSTFVAGAGVDLSPIRTAGATTSAEDGRRMLLMVAAAAGVPESFFGDVSVGTLATARSLDRPTELKFVDRQSLWKDVLGGILDYVVDQVAMAPKGSLKGHQEPNPEGDGTVVVLDIDPDTGEPIDRHIDIDFPSILEHDKEAEVRAIISAATLDGKAPAGTMDMKLISRLLLTALGQDDIDDLLDRIFPEGEGEVTARQAEQLFVQSVNEMREALRALSGHTV